jgi:hypothetical protein
MNFNQHESQLPVETIENKFQQLVIEHEILKTENEQMLQMQASNEQIQRQQQQQLQVQNEQMLQMQASNEQIQRQQQQQLQVQNEQMLQVQMLASNEQNQRQQQTDLFAEIRAWSSKSSRSNEPTTDTPTTKTPTTTIPTSISIHTNIVDALLELRSNSQPSNLSHVEKVFTDNATLLAPLESICPKIQILLSHLLTNATTVKQKKTRVSAGSEATRLHDLTDAEAEVLGKSFKKFLLGNKEVETAVNAWKLDNPILKPLFTELTFEPIVIGIGKDLIFASTLGLVKRVVLGAGLSIMDMITDIFVIRDYLRIGDTTSAHTLMAMIGLSIVAQLILAYVQNRKKSKWVILRELLIVLSGLKPAVDAYRVAMGYEDELSALEPLVEMSLGKGAELACESIPGERVKK